MTSSAQRPLVIDTTTNMVRAGHLIPSAKFRSMMGWKSPASLAKALAAGRVFALTFEGHEHFPSFFADPAYNRRQLYAVTKMLGDLPGGAKLQFFLARKGSLSGATPLAAIASGRLEQVLRMAGAYAEA